MLELKRKPQETGTQEENFSLNHSSLALRDWVITSIKQNIEEETISNCG
ncbi:MAG: hypothetical protein HC796_02200 [Synechococcaceae cyanobacterium RL_1_2]|nr:hypothetical protein [Synechococcaceae cyanobacterium RL_1_2]